MLFEKINDLFKLNLCKLSADEQCTLQLIYSNPFSMHNIIVMY